ncbi:MAG: nicotinamide-nucleotide adenylyltransferase [Candidatus Bathyarchaeota archaeon]|nr:MAG: nicotinamide-nucleotide adenylyltransferase [Candidatus Bathyarchaeota archaeon]
MTNRGLFVGRFQPFHKGHLEAVKAILKRVDELVIVVGSSQYSHTLDNPFTAGERITMIRRSLEEEDITQSKYLVVPVPDLHIHAIWVAQVVGYCPEFVGVYTNEPLTRRLFIEAGYSVEPVPFHRRKIYSSTNIRKRILIGEGWEELVAESVAEFIKEIDGLERLRDLAETDKT